MLITHLWLPRSGLAWKSSHVMNLQLVYHPYRAARLVEREYRKMMEYMDIYGWIAQDKWLYVRKTTFRGNCLAWKWANDPEILRGLDALRLVRLKVQDYLPTSLDLRVIVLLLCYWQKHRRSTSLSTSAYGTCVTCRSSACELTLKLTANWTRSKSSFAHGYGQASDTFD